MTDVVRKLIEATKEYLRITDRATDANARVRAAIAAVEREDKPEPPASGTACTRRCASGPDRDLCASESGLMLTRCICECHGEQAEPQRPADAIKLCVGCGHYPHAERRCAHYNGQVGLCECIADSTVLVTGTDPVVARERDAAKAEAEALRQERDELATQILNAHSILPKTWVYTDSLTTIDLLVAEITCLTRELAESKAKAERLRGELAESKASLAENFCETFHLAVVVDHELPDDHECVACKATELEAELATLRSQSFDRQLADQIANEDTGWQLGMIEAAKIAESYPPVAGQLVGKDIGQAIRERALKSKPDATEANASES